MISENVHSSHELTAGTVKWIKDVELKQLFRTFKLSFSSYPVRFDLSMDQFREKFVRRLQLDKDLSPGYFVNSTLAGFIFTGVREIANKFIAYNGGTGVIPKFRGNGIVYQLYDHLIPELNNKGFNESILEVLTQNKKAIHIYHKCGFEESRILKCYKLNPLKFDFKSDNKNNHLSVQVFGKEYISKENWWDYPPSLLDLSPDLNNLAIGILREESLAGYICLNPNTGRISQIAVDPAFRNQGIASILMREAYHRSQVKELSILNVDARNVALCSFLGFSGFHNEIDQFEMVLKL